MRKNSSFITIIGGFPKPIGGVTTFVSRLAARNVVSEVIDLYPSRQKYLPTSYRGKTHFVRGPLMFLFYYWGRLFHWSGRLLHFNFSRSWSILIFLLLPKLRAKF